MTGFTLQHVSFVLLLFTALLSSQAHVFRVQTSIREAIEQLDAILVTKDSKIQPVLGEFSYAAGVTLGYVPIESRTTVCIRFYSARQPYDHISSPHTDPFWWLDDDQVGDLTSALSQLPDIDRVTRTDDGLMVAVHTRNPVVVQRATQSALTSIRYSYVHRNKQ